MKILGIETSCDETAAAIVAGGRKIISNVVASSSDFFQKYGGVVPEIAARKQVEYMIPVLTQAMLGFTKDDIDAIAVTIGPGLIGSLLVGVETAKTLALSWNKPIIPVNHVIAHMYANFITNNDGKNVVPVKTRIYINNSLDSRLPASNRRSGRGNDNKIEFPAISLVVSGGHTELYFMKNEKELTWLGGTLDDAAGEAFDKTARLLGFGNRGGKAIEVTAKEFNPKKKLGLILPRPMMHDESLNFSFSGLKTAVVREWKKHEQKNKTLINEFAHEIEEAITDVLVAKTIKAAQQYHAKSLLVSGGVAANSHLREKFNQQFTTLRLHSGRAHNLQLFVPARELCTDNAVSIAACAYYLGKPQAWKTITAVPDLSVE